MNAVMLANGFRSGKHAGAKKALDAFWREVSSLGEIFNPIKANLFEQLRDGWNLDGTFTHEVFQFFTRSCSPYKFNPFNLNPLRDLLSRIADGDIINRGGDIPRSSNSPQTNSISKLCVNLLGFSGAKCCSPVRELRLIRRIPLSPPRKYRTNLLGAKCTRSIITAMRNGIASLCRG